MYGQPYVLHFFNNVCSVALSAYLQSLVSFSSEINLCFSIYSLSCASIVFARLFVTFLLLTGGDLHKAISLHMTLPVNFLFEQADDLCTMTFTTMFWKH